MNLGDIVVRADQVLALGEAVLATQKRSEWGWSVASDRFTEFRSASLSFLAGAFGARHPYYGDFDARVTDTWSSSIQSGIGILRAARDELAGGWLRTTRGLLSAEIFGDFLEMADHLLSEHYKDAAAVVCGSALEEHLRQLAAVASVPVNVHKGADTFAKKADSLNADLAKADAYSKLDQKSITVWLDVRNKAAHGKYSEYEEAQVGLMIEGVRQFIARVQA